MVIRMPIDLKSLYLNIKNDNLTGHTPTVATPLRQGGSIHKELSQILNIPENISLQSKENLSLQLLSKSRAEAKIIKTFIFDKISVNGNMVNNDCSYCVYIREETDPCNVHCGRQKVHYPQMLIYEDNEISINNNQIIKSISDELKNYAFIVQAFEYDTDTKILNFDALIVGENDIPYSKVFLVKRGVGDKFVSIFNEYADIYDSEIISMRCRLGYDKVSPDNFMDVMNSNKERALSIVACELDEFKTRPFTVLSEQYPYSLFDFELRFGMQKKYIIVRFTSTKMQYFNLPSNMIKFINDFRGQVELILITDINGNPEIRRYNFDEINAMKKTVGSVTYEVRG